MKMTLLVLCLLVTTAAFGQYYGGGISAQPQVYHSPEHPSQALYTAMAVERSVVGGGAYTAAQGDRPASDFPQQPQISLGDQARELKKEHEQVKKSRFVWINQ
jgi:hypothetical protein